MPDRECVICEKKFTPRSKPHKTCSPDCSGRYKRQLSRESQKRHYKQRAPRPDTQCESCSKSVAAPKTGPMPRWCQQCRAAKRDEWLRKRVAVRRCYKCQEPVPNAKRQPGKAVCDNCRVDKRQRGIAHERRRTLRKYGITQERYDQALIDQDGCCPGCGAPDPGGKGWCIEHDHKTGKFRGLMCFQCNTAIGLVDENPETLRTLASWLERMAQVG